MALRPVVLAFLMFVLAAPAAQASEVALEGGTLTYTAAPGEANDLSLSVVWGSYVVEDRGAEIAVSGKQCDIYLTGRVYCPEREVQSIRVVTADGDDKVAAANGIVEEISCGTGADWVDADAGDVVAADCSPDLTAEEPPTEQPPTEEPPAEVIDDAPVTVSAASVTMDARGTVPVEVACPATAADGCVGRVTLSMPTAGVAMARRSARVLGRSRRFKLAAGQSRVVPVRLSRRSARIIRTRGGKRRRVKLVVTVEVATATGTETVTSTITVTMRRSARPRRSR